MSDHVEKLESAVDDLRTVARGLRIPLDTSQVDAALKALVEWIKTLPSFKVAEERARRTEKAEKPEA